MSDVFQKAILRVGTYHSPSGTVEVTSQRLRHWANESKRLQAAGYAIPMHWDHANDLELLAPISMDVLNQGKERSAKNTVGKLEQFDVAPDGSHAEITIRALTDDAKKSVKSNAVFVSPVIFPEWKDGRGQLYRDCITSVDLVDHPVDFSQGKFTPKTMSLAPMRGIICMGFSKGGDMGMNGDGGGKEEDDDKSKKPEGDTDGGGDSGSTDDPNKKAKVGDDSATVGDDGDNFDGTEPGEQTGGDVSSITDVLDSLKSLNIILPSDTTPQNFIERLRPALMTAVAQSGGMAPSPSMEDDNQADQATVVDPQIATMSLQVRRTIEFADQQHRKTVNDRLQALLEDGKCTPAEHGSKRDGLTAIRLSLGADGNPRKSKLEEWIESREAVPRGTFWDADTKTKRMSLRSVKAPESVHFDASKPSLEEIKEAVKALGGDPNKVRG